MEDPEAPHGVVRENRIAMPDSDDLLLPLASDADFGLTTMQ